MPVNDLLYKAKLAPMEWQSPMLATLTYTYFSHPDWIFECKFDGERCLAYSDEKGVITLYSRNKKILNSTYPELVEVASKPKYKSFIVDGEIVAIDKNGISNFSKLQKRIQLVEATKDVITSTPVYFYLFDIQYFDGHDVRMLPLFERKELLREAICFNSKVIWTEYRKEHGLEFYASAKQKGWEGIIAKNIHSLYKNCRSKDWLKFKCGNSQEFIIIGYTDPSGSRIEFGALLLAYYQDNKLRYAGKVGTGLNRLALRYLKKQFDPIERAEPNAIDEEIKESTVHWLEPKLVCEVGFSEWTPYGKLRHPRYLGFRTDKDPMSVIREI